MSLRQLTYFVAVAQEEHFGRAAARLQMAQPPLSQQIRQLESRLGVQLLRRTTRRVELTPAGAAYLERAQEILAAVEDAGHVARLVAAGSVGRLTIGCVGSATYSLLPDLARGLSAELPGVHFAFRGEMLVPQEVDALRAGHIDIALLRPPVPDASITTHHLRFERLVVALPTGHRLSGRGRLSTRDLRDEPLIAHSGRRDSAMSALLLRLCRSAGFEPSVRHEVDETSTLITLVAGGLGVAIVPEPVTALGLDGVLYVPLNDTEASTELAVAHLTDRTEPHLERAVAAVRRLVDPTFARTGADR
jgi:DNA-binding transcriptional LysR family regulator